MHTIELQWPGKSIGEAQDFCQRFGCTAQKTKHKGYFLISTDDPINFYWLGCNMHNAWINEMCPSNISKYVEL